jgi:hypothetical protein
MHKVLLTTIALAGVGAVSSAGADTISIGWSDSATGAPTTVATTTTPGIAVSVTKLDSFESNVITGSDFSPLDLGATSSDFALGKTKPIYLYISETGISTGSPESFYIALSEGSLAAGWSVTESAYLGPDDTVYGKGTLLASDTFSGATPGSASFTVVSPVSAPYSITEEIAITPGSSKGQDLSTISVTTVPESSTWAMMTLGFAGLGYAAFRRRAKSRIVGEPI